jgi:hypothetical protein
MNDPLTARNARYQRLHEGVLRDPEGVWQELRAYLCGPTDDRSVDLIEDLMFWHAAAFVERVEALVEECPSVAETVASAYVGGTAAEGVDQFHALQDRILARMETANELSALERDVMETLLSRDHPVLNALRRQFEQCHVVSRKLTGVGFYTDLAIAEDFAPAPVKPGRFALGDVTATVDGLERGAGFALFVEDGVLDFLEGFSYDEPWLDVTAPHVVSAGGITHSGGSLTDIEQVDAIWDRSVR